MTVLQSSHPDLAEHLLDARYVRRIYAEGDSWFSAGGFLNGSLLDAISRIKPDWLIVTSAYPGDRLVEIDEVSQGEYQWMLMPTDGMARWDALLISGGGNDLLGNAIHLVNSDGIDPHAVMATLTRVAQSLDNMIRSARIAQHDLPVFINAYDYPHPVNAKTPWIVGPWMGPALAEVGLPKDRWREAAMDLVNSLHAALLEVCGRWPDVEIVDARNQLGAPNRTWWSPITSDWANEIHPSAKGYDKHAQRWAWMLDHRFNLTH